MRMLCLVIVAMIGFGAAPSDLVIQEWGTFTSLQNERGEALGGINVDDEPVPNFVHALPVGFVANSPPALAPNTEVFMKGPIPMYHPQVTMRLETPVVYFYDRRPMGGEGTRKVDLRVTFNGGYLSQFYPKADFGDVPKVRSAQITKDTVHSLTWKDVEIGTNTPGPQTNSKVWLAPRETKSDGLTVNGESEKYLFYRGVGQLNSPLRVIRTSATEGFLALEEVNGEETRVNDVWLIDIREGGSLAWRPLQPAHAAPKSDVKAAKQQLSFDEGDYAVGNLKAVRDVIRQALISDGLYADEADAMLNTWEASYFKQPGVRVLYLVPQKWTEKVLPMKVSVEASVTRVMVGRIDLVTPAQRELLKTISRPDEVKQLGRFAAAILNDEQKQNPSPRIQALIAQMAMTPVRVSP